MLLNSFPKLLGRLIEIVDSQNVVHEVPAVDYSMRGKEYRLNTNFSKSITHRD